MPDEDHRATGRTAACLALPALLLAAAPAAAEQVSTELRISATVVAACLVSTSGIATDPDAAPVPAMACTDSASWAFSVEHGSRAAPFAARVSGRVPAGAPAREAGRRPAPARIVTIFY
ncbi:MAG TPA: hypothetical protein VN231_07275 [Allosphingosinicella sp.]|nr:hypothetical protein [Allosphingosinicella sp.]